MSGRDDHEGIGQEPRKVWINKLLNKLDAAWYPLFTGNVYVSIRAMRGVIRELNRYSKEKPLAPLLKQLEDYEHDLGSADRLALERAYSEIMDYLHANQLKEYDRGIDESDFERLERDQEREEE
jgi:hypothetical protein